MLEGNDNLDPEATLGDPPAPEAPAAPAALAAPHHTDKAVSPVIKVTVLSLLRIIRSVVSLNGEQSTLWDSFVQMLEALVL